jgi:hypothetical protein
LQNGAVKTLTALSGVAYTENQRDSRSHECTEVVPKKSSEDDYWRSGRMGQADRQPRVHHRLAGQ